MSRAQDLSAKAARLKARPTPGASPAPAAPPGPPSTGDEEVPAPPAVAQLAPAGRTEVSSSVPTEPQRTARAVRTRPVRLTVDVAPAEHAELGRLALEAAAELGVARVHGQEIVRALIRRYLADPEVQRAALDDIARVRQSR